ncbi:hypothetical protein ADK78_17735 [Kitasatospora aureofaciens]|nr:hypothetical protein ADK78_17735 [Kitasatospora aureofaciens]
MGTPLSSIHREEHHPMNAAASPATSFATECFDNETLALLEEAEVPLLPDFDGIDLDVVFGTPLELHEAWATPRELARLQMRVGQVGKAEAERELLTEFFARRHAAADVLTDAPAITARLRERLVDVLLPYAVPLPIAA